MSAAVAEALLTRTLLTIAAAASELAVMEPAPGPEATTHALVYRREAMRRGGRSRDGAQAREGQGQPGDDRSALPAPPLGWRRFSGAHRRIRGILGNRVLYLRPRRRFPPRWLRDRNGRRARRGDAESRWRRSWRLGSHASRVRRLAVTNLCERYRSGSTLWCGRSVTTERPQARHSIGIRPAKAAASQ